VFVTLHVGTGTFLPVRSDNIAAHRMHAETFSISATTAAKISSADRIVAVGTTVVRVLETVALQIVGQEVAAATLPGIDVAGGAPALQSRLRASPSPKITAQSGATDIFIYPPFKFRAVDVLLTNFHLPRSTLLMLVSAFAGRDLILRAYEVAKQEGYRFYSLGDACLILD